MIDDEIRAIIDRNYERARKILEDNMDILHAMTEALVKYETIDLGQIDDLMERKPVREPSDWSDDDSNDSGNAGDDHKADGIVIGGDHKPIKPDADPKV